MLIEGSFLLHSKISLFNQQQKYNSFNCLKHFPPLLIRTDTEQFRVESFWYFTMNKNRDKKQKKKTSAHNRTSKLRRTRCYCKFINRTEIYTMPFHYSNRCNFMRSLHLYVHTLRRIVIS